MCLEDKIDQLTYEAKMEELSEKSKKLLVERQDYVAKQDDEKNLKRRTKEFKALLEKNQVLEEFDRGVFESIIEKVIVGEIDENGNKDPYKLTFVYKTGISNKVDPKIQQNTKLGESLKAELKKMCSHAVDEVKEACSHILLDTCGSRMLSTKEGFVEILEFTHFARIFKFNRTPEYREDSHKTILKKEISHEIKVSVVMELV